MQLQILFPHNVYPYIENSFLYRLTETRSTEYGRNFIVSCERVADLYRLIEGAMNNGARTVKIIFDP